MLVALVELISNVIYLYSLVLLVWIVLGWLISFNIVNRHQSFVSRTMYVLDRLTEPVLRPIRKYMPDLGGVDISPIVLILLLQFAGTALRQMFYSSVVLG